MDCQEALPCMHEYLDGQLDPSLLMELRFHLGECGECARKFSALEKTEAMLRAHPTPAVPADLADKIMAALPPIRRHTWRGWIKRHPALAAAAAFLLIMASAFALSMNGPQQMTVSGTGLSDVVIHGHTVIVPKGQTVEGSLTVKHGDIDVEGRVDGDLVVVDGSYNLASTAYVSGQIKSVNQTLDWIWYWLQRQTMRLRG